MKQKLQKMTAENLSLVVQRKNGNTAGKFFNLPEKVVSKKNLSDCKRMHKVDCIWFKSLNCGVTWALLRHTLLFLLHAAHTATKAQLPPPA
jgi:hypothetical protein